MSLLGVMPGAAFSTYFIIQLDLDRSGRLGGAWV